METVKKELSATPNTREEGEENQNSGRNRRANPSINFIATALDHNEFEVA